MARIARALILSLLFQSIQKRIFQMVLVQTNGVLLEQKFSRNERLWSLWIEREIFVVFWIIFALLSQFCCATVLAKLKSSTKRNWFGWRRFKLQVFVSKVRKSSSISAIIIITTVSIRGSVGAKRLSARSILLWSPHPIRERPRQRDKETQRDRERQNET